MRADDFARCYAPYDPQRARLKAAQSRTFGAAHVALLRRDWADVAGALERVADSEEHFARATLVAASTPV